MNYLPHVLGVGNAGAGFKCEYIGDALCGSVLQFLFLSGVVVGVVECFLLWWICLREAWSFSSLYLRYACCACASSAVICLACCCCGWLRRRSAWDSIDSDCAAVSDFSWLVFCNTSFMALSLSY